MAVATRSSSHRRRVGPKILLLDNFSGNQLDSGLWTSPDSENKITVTGGNFDFSGGLATPGWADPAAVSKPNWARRARLTIEWQVTPTASTNEKSFGFTDGTLRNDGLEDHGFYLLGSGVIRATMSGGISRTVPLTYSAATSYWGRIVCLATGAYYYISTDNRVTWYLVWINTTVTTSPLHAYIESYNAALTASKCEVSFGSVIPALLSASPAAPTLTPGNNLVLNGDFPTDTTNWTAQRSGTIAVDTATLKVTNAGGITAGGASQPITVVNGDWCQYWLDIVELSGITGGYLRVGLSANLSGTMLLSRENLGVGTDYTGVFRATATTIYADIQNYGGADGAYGRYDNSRLKNLPFDTTGCLTYIGDSGKKLGIAKANITVAALYHAGFVVCADSATAPSNCLYLYYDRTGGKAYLVKVTAGVTAELVAATVAYGAANELRIVITGPVTAARVGLYYGTVGIPALQGSIQGPYDLSSYGNHCFGFQTSSAELVQNFEFHGGVGI